jgi:phosphosulfolactate synthase (CoM biosynthesis protein A)
MKKEFKEKEKEINKITQSIEIDKVVFKSILMQEINYIVFNTSPEMNVVLKI